MEHVIGAIKYILVDGGILFLVVMAGTGFYYSFCTPYLFQWPWLDAHERRKPDAYQHGIIAGVYSYAKHKHDFGFRDINAGEKEHRDYIYQLIDEIFDEDKRDLFKKGTERGEGLVHSLISQVKTAHYHQSIRPMVLTALDDCLKCASDSPGADERVWAACETIKHMMETKI